tara:strand:- start:2490 stop:3290 length:801 start_codon:yes stop_codon:yes gene_type:complete
MGGLGNQMFQYACAKAIAEANQTKAFVDKSFLEDKNSGVTVFRNFELDLFPNIKAFSYAGEQCEVIPVHEPHYHCSHEIKNVRLNENQHLYLVGYWQTYKYFESIEKKIRHEFMFPDISETKTEKLRQKILSENSVMINVRRADYLTDSLFEDITMDYYDVCISKIENMIVNPTFYVFSDDVDWCKQNFDDDKFTVVDHSHKGQKFIDYLNLMSSCKHHIIPNSTFAWWSAWLNENDDKIVFYPSKWFTDSNKKTEDLFPSDWIKV